MHGWKAFHYSAWSLRRKLFGYMLLLTMLLLLALVGGLLFFELFDSVEKRTHEALDIQLEIFEKDVSSHFENLAAAGLQLSHAIGGYLDDYLAEEEIGLTALNDDTQRLEQIQREWIEPLQETMQKENCSGVFFMLDATVNSGVADAEYSRAGLYLQRNGYQDSTDESLLLYRGPAELGKTAGIMPHRKWRLEFRTDLFPNYRELCACAEKTRVESYLLTDRFVLPGTSDEAVLMTAPIVGADGAFYGVCGYEVSTSYFTAYHAQPTKLSSLTCMVVP
ncbi:MAG: LuxR family transcriptional regulator, partial [Clostridia bacterium]|nr:LuxR family transcriptional regulator [Clostridia bacterium]